MKSKSFFCLFLCLCILFSALLSACRSPEKPTESSVPAEESSEGIPSIPEDPNAKTVRFYLEELLKHEKESGNADWLTDERAETIRGYVKELKAPILTEEDALHIAETALTVVTAAEEQFSTLMLPACGLLSEVTWSPVMSFRTYEDFYRAMVGYTLYLFTPPDYLFRQEEVTGTSSPKPTVRLYLPLAGNYATRREALDLLREGKNGVELPVSGFGTGAQLLEPYRFEVPVLPDGSTLDLPDVVMRGNVPLPERLFRLYMQAYVNKQLFRFSGLDIGSAETYKVYIFPDGTWDYVFMGLTPEEVQRIRAAVELLSGPILTEETARGLAKNMLEWVDPQYSLVLPGFDGKDTLYLWADETWRVGLANRATAYLIDLFTPSAYRFEDLPGFPGTCYATGVSAWEYESPEDVLWDFNSGFTRMVWVGDDGVPYFVDRNGIAESLKILGYVMPD